MDAAEWQQLLREALLLEGRMADIENKVNELKGELDGYHSRALILRRKAEAIVEDFERQ